MKPSLDFGLALNLGIEFNPRKQADLLIHHVYMLVKASKKEYGL